MITAILAGGLATRLRPLTQTIPKVLLDVADKPFLEHQLSLLRRQGLLDVVLCVGFLGERIRDMFGDGQKYGVHLQYSFDGPTLLGTGGAIRKALPLLGETFFILYGDSYLLADFHDVHRTFLTSGKAGLMSVFRNCNHWDKSNVSFEEGRIKLYDKTNSTPEMQYIDYGLSAFKASVFAQAPEDTPFDLAEIQKGLVARGELAGYEVHQRFYEIGSQAGLHELDQFLRSQPIHTTTSEIHL